ncbi:MAG: hypothetical protein P8M30_14110 [Planctomycetaceae bacterium]|nr:hypothetical protein [bacterium]MDB4679757.1 hypothetical protein [Planctomycetaceae bacterium]MDC0307581.1 hypothetical protein [Planctomycetaceae bacterium]MDG2390438.1 hypothetical protein [Planctomycetaceae bacterium]
MLVHYDLFVRYRQDGDNSRFDKLLKDFDQVDVITLYAKRSCLFSRSLTRFTSQIWQAVKFPVSQGSKLRKFFRQLTERRVFYEENSNVLKIYEKWFRELDHGRITNHWLLESSTHEYGQLLTYQPDLTEEMFRQYYADE